MRELSWIFLVMCCILAGCGRKITENQALSGTVSGIPVQESYWVELPCGRVDKEAAELDLSCLTREQVESTAKQLPLLKKVTRVELGTSELTPADVLRLQQALPEAEFHYCFTLLGQPVCTTDTAVEIVNGEASGDYEQELRQALELMRNCQSLRLDNCGVDNEVMAQIREDYRDRTKVVWRVFFAKKGSCMTDRKVIRYVYNMDDSNCSALKYCEDAEYVDFGHNETLTDCSWAAGMPRLKAAILSGSLVSDLSGFAACEDLEFLELAYCSRVKDLSPLENCRKLKMVNTSFTGVSDFSPLNGAPLERLCSVSSKAPPQEQERFRQVHPDCLTLFRGKQPYGYCWRYEKDGCTPTSYYALLKEVFHYPDTHDTTW